ncbi:MAG: extracellular solute-binding protein [Betaproteobacteria bacterium]
MTMTNKRRDLLVGAAASAAVLACPGVLRAETRELVVSGPAQLSKLFRQVFFSRFEQATNVKILFDEGVSLSHLEKLRANRNRPISSIVMIDDPVMVTANNEGLITPITPAAVPNLSRILPSAIHKDGAWINYMFPVATIAYNTNLLPGGVAAWADAWQPKFKGQVIVPTLQLTQGVLTLIVAAHLETGLPFEQALQNIDAGFTRLKVLKPNVLAFMANTSQAWNLLEQGEGSMMLSVSSQPVAARRKQGVPINTATPREGMFAMPNAIALVKNGPQPELAAQFINALCSDEYQSLIAGNLNSNPVNLHATVPAGFERANNLHVPDWEYITAHRAAWADRWAREIAG